jgi:hypothetical protein
VVAVALEGEDDVDEVLEELGAGEVAFLGDVADDGDRGAGGLGERDEVEAAAAQLLEAAGDGVDVAAVGELDGVEDEELGARAARLLRDDGEVRFREEEEVRAARDVGAALEAVWAALSSLVA